ncbi:dermonecrotic toxin domain-containing protein [Pseudomonas akapageensis]|uniref:dermonecrotic toxin domain-containing protein n=1 Tax=Pseudomonas akapageensis TaxID=2609961 RepID=UPI00140DFA4B|nr:DUF6543 domain-containing protein [Pseudomonas akapageensis]
MVTTQSAEPSAAPAWLDSMEGAGNALFQAQQQVAHAVSRLHQLARLAPVGQTREGSYWVSRAPETSISRWSAVFESLIEYFKARADIDYGLLKLPHAGWKWALEFLANAQAQWNADGRFEQTSIPHALFCVALDNRQRQLTAGFVVFRNLDETGECLLFSMGNGCRWFTDKKALQDFVEKLYARKTGATPDPTRAFTYLPITRNPLTMMLESILIELRNKSINQFEKVYVKDVSQAVRDQIQWRLAQEGCRDSELINFGSLDPRFSVAYREKAVGQMEESILDYIGEPAEGSTASNRLRQLQESSIAAQQRREQAHSGLRALIDASRASNWQAGRNQAFKVFCKQRARRLLDEARSQRTLGQLSQLQLAMIEELVSKPVSDSGIDRLSVALELTIHSDTERWKVAGALVFMVLDVYDEPDEQSPALLYVPGEEGGLAAFDNATQLRSALGRTLRERTYSALLDNLPYGQEQAVDDYLDTCAEQGLAVGLEFSVLAGDIFEQSLLAQLENDRRHARLIAAGRALFADAPTIEQSLARLQVQTFATLAVPSNAVREAAYARVSEQMLILPDADSIKKQFDLTTSASREAAQNALEGLRSAFVKANRQLTQLLPGRVAFVESLLRPRLERDIGLVWPFKVSVEIPGSVEPVLLKVVNPRGGTYTAAEYRAAGEGLRRRAEDQHWIFVYSYEGQGEWTTVALGELALSNLDSSTKEQLKAAEFVVESEHVANQEKLDNYPNLADYIIRLITSLDAAAAYSRKIESAYRSPGSTAFERGMIVETLQAPWRWVFELYTLAASQRLSTSGKRILEALAKGHAPSELQLQGFNVALKTPKLTSASTLFNSPDISLNGLLFIEDQVSKKTVMFLPGAPNARVLGEYATIEAACDDLVQMTASSEMTAFVAGCAVDGDTVKHIAYIEEAWRKSFRSFITVDTARDSFESVPACLLDAERVQAKVRHQKTSRTNYQVRLLDEALEKQLLIDKIKQAMGFVPGIGVAISAYDFWVGSNAVVRAYLEGRNADANGELVSVAMSLVDVVGNLGPVAASLGKLGKLSRTRAIARYRHAQLALLDNDLRSVKLKGGNELRASGAKRYAYDPFEGRESLVSLVDARKVLEGDSAGTFFKDGKHYIQQDGNVFAVFRKDGIWRLSQTSTAKYEQPITLNRDGRWVTSGSISGRLVENGLQGGGWKEWWVWLRGDQGRGELPTPGRVEGGADSKNISSQLKKTFKAEGARFDQSLKSYQENGDALEFNQAVTGYIKVKVDQLDRLLDANGHEVVTNFYVELRNTLESFGKGIKKHLKQDSDVSANLMPLNAAVLKLDGSDPLVGRAELKQALENIQRTLANHGAALPWKNPKNIQPVQTAPNNPVLKPDGKTFSAAKALASKKEFDDFVARLEGEGPLVSADSIESLVKRQADKYKKFSDLLEPFKENPDVKKILPTLKARPQELLQKIPGLKQRQYLLSDPTKEGVESLLNAGKVEIQAVGRLQHDTAKGEGVFRYYIINKETKKLHAVTHFHFDGKREFNLDGNGFSFAHFKRPSEANTGAGKGAYHYSIEDMQWLRSAFSPPLHAFPNVNQRVNNRIDMKLLT